MSDNQYDEWRDLTTWLEENKEANKDKLGTTDTDADDFILNHYSILNAKTVEFILEKLNHNNFFSRCQNIFALSHFFG